MVFPISLSIILFLFRETRKERRPKVGVSASEAGTLEADTLDTSALLRTILGISHLSLEYHFLVSRDEKREADTLDTSALLITILVFYFGLSISIFWIRETRKEKQIH